MQFRYTQNAGDTVSAVFSLIFTISLPIAALLLRYKYYNADDSSDAENFKLIHDGLKEGKHQVMSWIFFLRRLLFAVVVAATVGGPTKSQAIALMTISILMMLTLLIIRPFQETLRNVMHIANEAGLISLCVGCLYYRHYIDIA
jgi:phosphotransferase system  glucose/maltose/N-acetylglucosamine-specific IIC component